MRSRSSYTPEDSRVQKTYARCEDEELWTTLLLRRTIDRIRRGQNGTEWNGTTAKDDDHRRRPTTIDRRAHGTTRAPLQPRKPRLYADDCVNIEFSYRISDPAAVAMHTKRRVRTLRYDTPAAEALAITNRTGVQRSRGATITSAARWIWIGTTWCFIVIIIIILCSSSTFVLCSAIITNRV